jgi:hypothetical protein
MLASRSCQNRGRREDPQRFSGLGSAATLGARLNGPRHGGRVFPSLGAVAKAIPGSHYNGYHYVRLAG